MSKTLVGIYSNHTKGLPMHATGSVLLTHSCTTPEIDLTGASRERREGRHTDTEKQGSGNLGSLMKKQQYPRNSVCLLYMVKQGGVVIAHIEQED